MNKPISLEQSLQAYRVLHTPTEYSWKQHWVQEVFDHDDMLSLNDEDKQQFSKRLKECEISILPSIRSTTGIVQNLYDLVNIITDPNNKKVSKINRKVVFSTSNGVRPVNDQAWELWNGFQVIDMDIKNEQLAQLLKKHIFNKLHKCNWFLGVTNSSSGTGLHIYTKILIPESDYHDPAKKKILYLTNFRHKYSFVYLACLSATDALGFTKEDLINWMDLMMFKPQQGAFIGYDKRPLINTRFFDDFIYVNYDNIEDLGHRDIDWITYPDLKSIFARWEWIDDNNKSDLNIEVVDKPPLEVDKCTKVHYKHFERWRLANTLVKLYGLSEGRKYLRMICSNNIKDKELEADCLTADRHAKPIDPWAVNRLNTTHGFKIKLNIQADDVGEAEILQSIERIENPTIIKSSKFTKTYNITKNQYLGDIREQLLQDLGRITLLEAGAGVGKTEMVKQLVRDGKKIIMVMPFTSTIKSKVEKDKQWQISYGNIRPKLGQSSGLSLTIDKFSHLNMMDIKTAGYDYIFIDESHLLFQSEYRPVMAKVIEMIKYTEVPVILMSGTPSGELVFFPDINHLKVIKEDTRIKEFNVTLVDSTKSLTFHMCKSMARDISMGKRILFPTNAGTLYAEQIKAGVTYFLQHDFTDFNELKLSYYKKSNIGEEFMDDVNFKKTIKDTQILLCTTYLSVGVDILDKYNFSIYFADLMMPQEVEQFANRLRSNDLFINLFIAKNDANGNSRSIHKYKEINFKLDDDEKRDIHSILQICNDMVKRNPIEYKYNSLVTSILRDNKFIEYDEIENKYYLNEIAYLVTIFERKYRDYVQQLPVLMKGMQSYGYQIFAKDISEVDISETNIFNDVKTIMRLAYDEQCNNNNKHIDELLDLITEDRLGLYKDVLKGEYSIKKGRDWKEDLTNKKITVKNIEVFEKVIPIFASLSKQYPVDQVRSIFEFCKKEGAYNFAAIKRIRTLVSLIYNDKRQRLDLPIKKFMEEVDKFYNNLKEDKKGKYTSVNELNKFIQDFAYKYASNASNNDVLITKSIITMDNLREKFMSIFKCIISVSRPNGNKNVHLSKVELLWTERINYTDNLSDIVYVIEDFLGGGVYNNDDEK